jgi:hypothetical protein
MRSGLLVLRSTAADERTRQTAAHDRLAAAPGRDFIGSSSATSILGLWCTVLSVVSSYTKLRSSRTYLDQKGGGSGDHDGAPWPAADGRPRHTTAMALTTPGARERKEAAPSP